MVQRSTTSLITKGMKAQNPRLPVHLPGEKKGEGKEKLQVILRPGPSSIGKSNEYRLYLRIYRLFLRRLSGPSILRELSNE
jgi:hypothetical protein